MRYQNPRDDTSVVKDRKYWDLTTTERVIHCYTFGSSLSVAMTSRSIGYSRKSTSSQTNDPDVEALKANGCHQIFQEKISSRVKAKDRPELQAALNCLIEGDCLVVTSLSRLARTQSECIEILHSLQERGIFIKSIDGLLDTQANSKLAPLMIGLLTGLNEIERDLIRERTQDSINHRRKTGGNLGGRPKTSDKRADLVLSLRDQGDSYRTIRDKTQMGYSTIRRIIVAADKV